MTEFYHKNIFGEIVNIDLQNIDEEKPILDKKGKEFNIFKFINAFARQNKKDAWVFYEEAVMAGVAAERIFFTLVWKVKSMLLLKRTPDLEKLSEALVIGYHQARRGKGELETLIEKTILKL